MLITKGAPEGVLARCLDVPEAARPRLDAEFAAGQPGRRGRHPRRPGRVAITRADEHDLRLRGLLVFLDPPKPNARQALDRLAGLGVTVKVDHRGQPGGRGEGLRRPRPAGRAGR